MSQVRRGQMAAGISAVIALRARPFCLNGCVLATPIDSRRLGTCQNSDYGVSDWEHGQLGL